jgi:hypothetical protein
MTEESCSLLAEARDIPPLKNSRPALEVTQIPSQSVPEAFSLEES